MNKTTLLATAVALLLAGVANAADVFFVSYDKEKKSITVKESKDAKENKTYTMADKVTYTNGDKAMKDEKATAKLEALKEGNKLTITAEKDKVSEIKFAAKKKN